MKFEIKVTGIDDAQRAIKEEQHRLERIPAEQEIPISELFPTEFLARYTQFGSLEEMFEASGFVVETAEDFDRVRGAEWDDFIRDHTRFSDWEEMFATGSEEWVERKLQL